MNQKQRIDLLLVEKGLETSRERAKALIMAGEVFANGQRVDKAGEEVDVNAHIEIHGGLKYVSRGGLKLEKAISSFNLDISGKTCMDIGASTGGFTDCMLQNGASKVYSVDVGYGQLAWKLRTDSRVINMERTNIRHLTQDSLHDRIDFFSVDVSFISLTLVLPVVKEFLSENACGVCLIKPQFEAGKGKVGKKGVVREPEIHKEVITKIYDFVTAIKFRVEGIDFSPIKGPEGNIEYLIYLKNSCQNGTNSIKIEDIEKLVSLSHKHLDGGA
ncbi:MAG TPA: TlyA family RNA methyltransferase [Ruminiclostridium sp.]|nr:TlyA family RNA methyltransferase [Ruminiclostridium sp.]